MEVREINIVPPIGMEIIEEIKNGVKTISFKQIEEKKITYKDVCDKLYLNNYTYFIGAAGVGKAGLGLQTLFDGNESGTKEEQEAFLALGKLRNVARYLNPEGWKYVPGKNKGWFFDIDDDNNLRAINCNVRIIQTSIYFESRELMDQAIEILGENTIRKSLILQL